MDADHLDPFVMVKADLVRGSAAYARDVAEELTDNARALRAKERVLGRRSRDLRTASLVLRDESDQLLRRLRR